MLEIEFWSDLYCPWAHVAAIRLRRARARFEGRARVQWRCWPLELVNRRPTPRGALETERAVVAQLEPEAFAPWKRHDYPYTLLPAMAALKCAALQGPEAEERYDAALRYGFFRDNRNLSLTHELLDLAVTAGVDAGRLEADLWAGLGQPALWRDWQESHTRPIQGSPQLLVVGSDLSLHNPGVSMHETERGIPIVDADDPRFLDRWLVEASAAGAIG